LIVPTLSSRPSSPRRAFPLTVTIVGRTGSRLLKRVSISIALALLAGCSADDLNSRLTFFPGAERASWSACDKFGPVGNDVQLCATFVVDPNTNRSTAYSISFYVPRTLHVRLAVFDAHGALVKVLLDGEESATIGQYRTPPVVWDFTDSNGARVSSGNYRCYFSAGPDYLSFSDVVVP
jgi:hypothetical protein